MKGWIVITDLEGRAILSCSVWTVVALQALFGRWSINPNNVQVLIDGEKIPMPDVFKDDE